MNDFDERKRIRLERIRNVIGNLEKNGIVTWLSDEREDDWDAIYSTLLLRNAQIGEVIELRAAVIERRRES